MVDSEPAGRQSEDATLNAIEHPSPKVADRYRRGLPHTWATFFGRFGALTEVQLRTIPAIMRGHNVVVSAPTASGKTEAVVAPVAELHASQHWDDLAVLYVVPTRALANNLYERLEGRLESVGIRIEVKHGDRPSLPSKFEWLITTPESLDSLICRQPERFSSLRSVIIDEVHVIDGGYRGDQVRILLARLKSLAAQPFSVHLLSATLPNQNAVAARYVDVFEPISVGGLRQVESHFCSSYAEILDLCKARRFSKVLFFCNTRREVEEAADRLRILWRPYPVVAHHGSLDRSQRTEAEEVMLRSQVAVCVATSTLEIGIDIGDIDLVVLAAPPWSIEALQQRIGRGSRRLSTIQAAAVYTTEDERSLLTDMFRSAGQALYAGKDYVPDRSVIVQQTLSLLFAHRTGLSQQELFSPLETLGRPDEVREIVFHLVDLGLAISMRDKFYPSSELIDQGEQGLIHSNIPDSGDYEVRDVESGQIIGKIRGPFDQVFLLAGRSWRVLGVRSGQIQVCRAHTAANAPGFANQRSVGRFHHLLPRHLQQSE